MRKLEEYDDRLDELMDLLERISKFYPSAAKLLQNLEKFRAEIEAISADLKNTRESLNGAIQELEESKEELAKLVILYPINLAFSSEKELLAIERALEIAIAIDSFDPVAIKVLDKVKSAIEKRQ